MISSVQSRQMVSSIHQLRTFQKIMVALGITSAVTLLIMPTLPGLSAEGMRALALLVWAACFWSAQVVPDHVTALFLLAGWIVLRVVPVEMAVASFSSPIWWLIFGSLGLGAAAGETGLMRRISLRIVMAFPRTYVGLCTGLFLAGLLFTPFVPSPVAKVAMAGPLALGMADAVGIPAGERSRAGLFFSAFFGFSLAAPMFLTGGGASFVIAGLLADEAPSRLTWFGWFLMAGPVVLLFLVAVLGIVATAYRPRVPLHIDEAALQQKWNDLGRMTRDEAITSIVLLAALLLWATESLHGIPAPGVAVLAVAVLLATAALPVNGFQQAMSWSTLLFIGVVLNLGKILPAVGIDHWLTGLLWPFFGLFLRWPVVFPVALGLMVVGLRFLIISWNALVILIMVVLIPLLAQVGIDAWATALLIYVVSQGVWVTPYQNVPYTLMQETSHGALLDPREGLKVSMVYVICALIFLGCAFPFLSSH